MSLTPGSTEIKKKMAWNEVIWVTPISNTSHFTEKNPHPNNSELSLLYFIDKTFRNFVFTKENIITTNDFIVQSTQTNLYQSREVLGTWDFTLIMGA